MFYLVAVCEHDCDCGNSAPVLPLINCVISGPMKSLSSISESMKIKFQLEWT